MEVKARRKESDERKSMVRVGQFGEGGEKRNTEKQPQIS